MTEVNKDIETVREALETLCDAADFPGANKESGEVPKGWKPDDTHLPAKDALSRIQSTIESKGGTWDAGYEAGWEAAAKRKDAEIERLKQDLTLKWHTNIEVAQLKAERDTLQREIERLTTVGEESVRYWNKRYLVAADGLLRAEAERDTLQQRLAETRNERNDLEQRVNELEGAGGRLLDLASEVAAEQDDEDLTEASRVFRQALKNTEKEQVGQDG